MAILFKNIRQLLQVRDADVEKVSGAEMRELPMIENAWLLVEDDLIKGFGSMDFCPAGHAEIIDATGRVMLPAWCDSHTHIVYAGNRELEFVDRINGLTYEQIAARGGGILNSAARVAEASEDELYAQSAARLMEVMKLGTGAIEIKSGYGLSTGSEIKMLRVARKLGVDFNLPVRTTFLGAHAFPADYKNDPDAYVEMIIEEMLPQIAGQQLADYIDAFCEKGYFSVEQTLRIMEAGKRYGLQPKIHVNQFKAIGGVRAAVDAGALSVDHLEVMQPDDYLALANSQTMPVALPSCSFFLGIPYTPAREIISRGLPVALATDYNPGSTPSGNMNFVVSLACIQMKMTPEEAINAATINGAYAMGLNNTHGSITIGKRANLILTRPVNSFYELPYSFGSNLIDKVMVNGEFVS